MRMIQTVIESIQTQFPNVRIEVVKKEQPYLYEISILSFTAISTQPHEEKKHIAKRTINELNKVEHNLFVEVYDQTNEKTLFFKKIVGEQAEDYLNEQLEKLAFFESFLWEEEDHTKMYGSRNYSKYEHQYGENREHEVFENPEKFYLFKEVVHDLPEAVFKYKLSEAFIEYYEDEISWDRVSVFQKLSEPFIAKHLNKMPMSYVCSYQKLSEDFIDEHKDDLSFMSLSKQKLSLEFIKKYEDKWYWDNLILYNHGVMPDDYINQHIDKLDWEEIIYVLDEYGDNFPEFIERFDKELKEKKQKEFY